MDTHNLPAHASGDSREAFRPKRLVPLDSLYSRVKRCEPATLSQALNLYIADVEALGLPEAVAASYMMVETLAVISQVLLEGGCPESAVPPELTCPRFDLQENSLASVREWSYSVLKCALEYRGRYSGTGGNLSVARARYYIDQHFTDAELMLKDAAAEAKMSFSRFSTVFAREMGRTFTEYVTDLRIRKACELLTGSPLRIAQIAAKVGYNDPHYFSWIFRKNIGRTPTEYRERGGEERTD